MRSAIDTNVVCALWWNPAVEPTAGEALKKAATEGALVICAVVYAELVAAPGATAALVDRFLADAAIELDPGFSRQILVHAAEAYRGYCRRRRKSGGGQSRRIIADFLIGAHAAHAADRLLTFNPKDYRTNFPRLLLAP